MEEKPVGERCIVPTDGGVPSAGLRSVWSDVPDYSNTTMCCLSVLLRDLQCRVKMSAVAPSAPELCDHTQVKQMTFKEENSRPPATIDIPVSKEEHRVKTHAIQIFTQRRKTHRRQKEKEHLTLQYTLNPNLKTFIGPSALALFIVSLLHTVCQSSVCQEFFLRHENTEKTPTQ